MSLNQILIAELKQEAASTRKMLERVPTDKNAWKPHEKSMSLGSLASHVAEIPEWITMMMETSEVDLATKHFKPYIAETNADLIAHFENKLEAAVQSLQNAAAEDFEQTWILRSGDHIIYNLPKGSFMRTLAFNHQVHHRGQLSVYLRMLDIPVPGMYGPTADDRN